MSLVTGTVIHIFMINGFRSVSIDMFSCVLLVALLSLLDIKGFLLNPRSHGIVKSSLSGMSPLFFVLASYCLTVFKHEPPFVVRASRKTLGIW